MNCFKCKMCGGDLNVTENEKVAECEYCGSRQTVPDARDEKRVNLFNRANRLRMASEFDKAGNIYEQIISEFPEEAEAYWGLCLCNYGIEYVDDPATAVKIPTCHRASFDKLRKDSNYELCLEYADLSARTVYEDQAREIDRIMGEILAVSRDEQPYDVFICYKETTNTGARTPDSVLAQDIYDALTQKGYRVFFSRITLEDKLGSRYEPYIFSALHSARIMLAVGTDYEYMNAVWVKNEWSRFIKLMAKDKTKVLIPCYKDMDAYDMPEELKGFQSQDCGKLGFMQDLVRGIDKLFGKDGQAKAKTSAPQSGSSATVDSLLQRAFMFLEDGKWKEADEYCEKVLDIEPQNARAYLGKLMAELKVKKQVELADCPQPFDAKNNYQKVLRFGDEKLGNELKGYITHINERNEAARVKGIYDNAQCTMHNAQSEDEYKKAAKDFESIADFKDAKALAEKCREQAEVCRKQAEERRRKKEEAEKREAERINQTVEAIRAAFEKKVNEKDYISLEDKKAKVQSKITGLTSLSAIFDEKQAELNAVGVEKKAIADEIGRLQSRRSSLGIFAGKEKKEIDRKIAELNEKTGGFEERAQRLRNDLKGYTSKASVDAEITSNQKQLDALNKQIEEKKRMQTSKLSFEQALEELKDGKVKEEFTKRYEKLYRKALLCNATVGDAVVFGAYPQDKNGKDKTPIEWRVLAKEDNKILVISDKALDCKQYNTSCTDVTWEACSLRKWMNGTFLNNAFSTEEQALIQSTTVSADKNPKYSTNPGNATTDKVFLLSITEVEKYFNSDEARKCAPTAYAKAQGVYTSDSYKTSSGAATCWWWLRSPGGSPSLAASVHTGGSVYCYGYDVSGGDDCVRPALWINLNS